MQLGNQRKSRKKQGTKHFENLETRELLAADLVALGPADDAGYVDPAADLTLTFDEGVNPGAGNITIFNAADDSVVETIDVTSDQVTFEGETVTVDPSDDLPHDAGFYVQVDDGAIVFDNETLYLEDFDGFELEPFVSAQTADNSIDGMDWTPSLPEGWVRDNTDTPDGGAVEYFGFNILNKDSWIAEQGNQDRTTFTKGSGGVLVSDPDAYDDSVEIDSELYNVFLTTQEFDLTGIPANSLTFQWDNSFRYNPTVDGNVDVSYDGGASWTQIFSQGTTSGEPGVDSLDAANQTIAAQLQNPSEGTAKFRFSMVNGSNDWWWAVDNVVLEAPSSTNADVYPGISGSDGWNFVTSPELEASAQSLSFTFAKDVNLTTGTGDFVVRRLDDGSEVVRVPGNSEAADVVGQTVTITLADTLPEGSYYVEIEDSVIFDTADVESTVNVFAENFENLTAQDSVLVGNVDVNNYVVVMEGVLDVEVAGTYTFGINSDDGQALYIDLDQDGLDLDIGSIDEVIIDDSTHGNQDRLSTCGIVNTTDQSCEGNGDFGFDLEIGEYPFQFWYFEAGGGSSGEFFYGPGDLEVFDAEAFAVVGDNSRGIGVTEAGITATLYKAAAGTSVNTLDIARSLVLDGDNLESTASEVIEFTDVYNTGGTGRFGFNFQLPGLDAGEGGLDWSPEAPEGWQREVTLPGPTAPEYTGWSFLNKEFWIAQQGNQDRTTFTKGQNLLAVFDPDAADDFIDIDPDQFAGSLTTPEIPLDGVDANSLKLIFDNSFRPYPTMQGLVEVSFDGGNSFDNLLTLDENTVDGGTSSLLQANETQELDISNPDSGTVKFRWEMINAGNDWWWAIDNIRVAAPFTGNPVPATGNSIPAATSGTIFEIGEVGRDPRYDFGDTNLDSIVDFTDFLTLSANFNEQGGGPEGDTNEDGMVDFTDFLTLSANFNKEVPPAEAVAASDAAFAAATDADDVDAEIEATLNLDI